MRYDLEQQIWLGVNTPYCFMLFINNPNYVGVYVHLPRNRSWRGGKGPGLMKQEASQMDNFN